jgi:hypothetical protein
VVDLVNIANPNEDMFQSHRTDASWLGRPSLTSP